MPLDPAIQKAVLDWIGGGAAVTRPGGTWIAFATGTPTASGDSAIGTNTMSRVTCTFAAANSPQGSMTNLAAVTCAANSSAATFLGYNIYESSSAGRRIGYNTLTASVSFRAGSGDQVVFSAGALKVTLA